MPRLLDLFCGVGGAGMGYWARPKQIGQAVPPAYTQWIGEQLMAILKS